LLGGLAHPRSVILDTVIRLGWLVMHNIQYDFDEVFKQKQFFSCVGMSSSNLNNLNNLASVVVVCLAWHFFCCLAWHWGWGLQPGAACSGQLDATFGQLGLAFVQLGIASRLACLLPLCCVGGHPGMPCIWSGRLGHWPGISFVQVGQFQLLSSLVWW
jgi:hypothetical protein